MRRVTCAPRHDWRETAERSGFLFHTIDGAPYWDESAYYAFTLPEIENGIEEPTLELHGMALDLVAKVVENEEMLERLAIPQEQWELVRDSWRRHDPHLYGRMDLCYDGDGPAKLYELNYDTPTSLYESAYFQWLWLEEMVGRRELPPQTDQYNHIQEDLIDAFTHLRKAWGWEATEKSAAFVFAAVAQSAEDSGTVEYLRDLAEQAGFRTKHLAIEEIGIDAAGRFSDLEDEVIQALFKLYPWEDLFSEEYGQFLSNGGAHLFEPPWKAILSNKGILPLLWEAHPNHPNLLPAVFADSPASVPAGWVRKPFFSREGANILAVSPLGTRTEVPGPYGGPAILQQYCPPPRFGDGYALVGSWMIGDRPSGLGMREDDTAVTRDTSRFVPHVILA